MTRSIAPLIASLFTAGAFAAEVEIITINTLQAQMRYDVTEFDVSPGANVKIIFQNMDDMPHNMVFVQPGTDVVAMANKSMDNPEAALKRDWLPEDSRMWAHSKLVNPKETTEITFKAPEKAGTYPYVCTFPGHAAIMQGKMNVVAPGPGLTDLKFEFFLGDWKTLPNFSTLKPHREGEIPDNLVQIKLDDYKNQFGVIYTGNLKAPKAGDYTFKLASDDGSRIYIDGRKVVENDGIHPSKDIREGKVNLKAGDHVFRLEYFQSVGQAELFAAWQGPGFTPTPLSKWLHPKWKDGGKPKKKGETTGNPLIVGQEPIIYRNFISGAGNRGIAVGYPGGFNIAWSADQFNLALVWRGAFIDAARHWNSRGGGHQPPLGYDVFRPMAEMTLPFAADLAADAEWPKMAKDARPEGYEWKGYSLDKKRIPTFHYEWKGVKVSERFDMEGIAIASTGKVVRTIKLDGSIPPNAMFCVATGASIEAAGGGFLVTGARLSVDGHENPNTFKVSVDGAKVSGKNLVLPARPEIKVTYTWPTSHQASAR